MSKAHGYSLWLMPKGEVYNKLNDLMLQLSEKYDTPPFEPHITLIGGVLGSKEEIVSKTAQLASVISPYNVTFGELEYLNEYFKCLFIKIKETKEVMNANLEAIKVFGKQSNSIYMPHLSLMYGDFSPEIKEEIIREIAKLLNLSFDVHSIHLMFTEGEVKDWYKVKEFSLN